jgi:ribosomal-protein-alanine N-acetyltransferase
MLETKRLRHRKFTPADLDRLTEMRSDIDVSRFIGGEPATGRDWNKARLDFYISCPDGLGMQAMIWKETGGIIGWSGLQPLVNTDEIEVGYGMIKEYWRKGIGYETALAWLKHGFENLGLERIVAVADQDNIGSWKIMEKLGMKFEGMQEHYGMNCKFYAISKDDRDRGRLRPPVFE